MIGLLLIAIGTGGIKPCVSAFGGDQFEAGQVCSTILIVFLNLNRCLFKLIGKGYLNVSFLLKVLIHT